MILVYLTAVYPFLQFSSNLQMQNLSANDWIDFIVYYLSFSSFDFDSCLHEIYTEIINFYFINYKMLSFLISQFVIFSICPYRK